MAKKQEIKSVPKFTGDPSQKPSKYNIIIMTCSCGADRETDLPLDDVKDIPCWKCGKVEWTMKNLKKKIANDPTAPLELRENDDAE